MPWHLDLGRARVRLGSPCPGAVRTPLSLPATHHNHAGDPVQQEWGVDLPEEAEQQPLALAGRGQLLGANAAADIQPGGLGGEALLVAPKQTPAPPQKLWGYQCAVPFVLFSALINHLQILQHQLSDLYCILRLHVL